MYILKTDNKLVIVLGIILAVGFLGVNISNYQVSTHSVRETLVNNELPLTSNNIYSEIQASLLRPVYISSVMANDTFLKDWLVGGEQELDKVTRYLSGIKQNYGVFSTFVVSWSTRRYYHYSGVLKEVSPEIEKDQWFFTMRTHRRDYRVDIDTNEASENRLTVFVNYKIFSDDGRFLGVTGLGLDVATVSSLIERYKSRFNRDIYFVDRQGTIKGHGNDRLVDKVNIHSMPGLSAIAGRILSGERGSLSYERDGGNIFLRYRYIPELDWFLVVEQPEREALALLRHSFYTNVAISTVITVLVLTISAFTVRRFQSKLEKMARVDTLSGLYSRQFFEDLFENAVNIASRHRHSLSLLLFDIDRFKEINDQHGHLAGDRVIRQVAEEIRTSRRDTDIICRWGGDEFVVLLSDCDLHGAHTIAEDMRQRVKNKVRVKGADVAVTISMGVVTRRDDEDLESLLARADARLYAAKKAGRDRVEVDGLVAAA